MRMTKLVHSDALAVAEPGPAARVQEVEVAFGEAGSGSGDASLDHDVCGAASDIPPDPGSFDSGRFLVATPSADL